MEEDALICQSCGMPLKEEQYRGTNGDGTESTEYCKYCFENGDFIDGCTTLKQKTEQSVAVAIQMGMPKQRAEDMAHSILPSLKRWTR